MKRAIKKNTTLMCNTLMWDDIKDRLFSGDIITDRQKDRIAQEKGDSNRIDAMLDILIRTDMSDTYQPFMDILANCGNAGETCANAIKNNYSCETTANTIETSKEPQIPQQPSGMIVSHLHLINNKFV